MKYSTPMRQIRNMNALIQYAFKKSSIASLDSQWKHYSMSCPCVQTERLLPAPAGAPVYIFPYIDRYTRSFPLSCPSHHQTAAAPRTQNVTLWRKSVERGFNRIIIPSSGIHFCSYLASLHRIDTTVKTRSRICMHEGVAKCRV